LQERTTLKPDFSAEGIYGGHLLGVRGASGLSFYDWQTTALIRRIDIECRTVTWADNGSLVTITTADSFFVLKCA
jgi:coatomer subunit beta'